MCEMLLGDSKMEKEIKKRSLVYAAVAILLATILGVFVYNLPIYPPEPKEPIKSTEFLSTFESYDEIRSFLTANARTQGVFPFFSPSDVNTLITYELVSKGALTSGESLRFEYSTTNIQVAGVDEADIVKTDGEHLYLISGNNVTIMKVYPPEEARVLSRITFPDTYPLGIFVSQNKLVVLGSHYTVSSGHYIEPLIIDIKTSVNVYDISEKSQPVLQSNFTMSGSYFHSRMIGEYLYLVVSQPAYVIYDTVVLPKVYTPDGVMEIDASKIHYANSSDNYYQFTTVAALNVQRSNQEPTYKTLLLGGTSSMYVSLNNIYVTFRAMEDQTSIYRIRVDEDLLSVEAHGKVPGHELNQFSMDEYNEHFRIATQTWADGTAQSNMYILNLNLTIVGKLENIAPGETLDSSRFIGNRAYLSTSVIQRDPFFVLDVGNPSNPKVLGYLKIPGFTRYLHPYDDNHLIGIGRDGDDLKISIFDVTNVSSPTEMFKHYFEGMTSDTPVLTEHKAFLFDKARELLALPVAVTNLDYSFWQGAYVFNFTLTNGLVVKGNVTHIDPGVYIYDGRYYVSRELYIENVFYTVSQKKVKMNNLSDLSLINEVKIP